MKRLAVITTLLFFTLSGVGTLAALADDASLNTTIYPEDGFVKTLQFTELNDYDIDIEGGAYYFLDGESCYKYVSGEITSEKHDEFSPALDEISTDRYYYYFTDYDSLKVFDKVNETTTTLGDTYYRLKKFDDSIYAVKDNELYRIEGISAEKVVLDYMDYSITETISVGQAEKNLKASRPLTFVTVKKGAYMTEIDLTSLSGEYFKLGYSKQKALDKESGLSDDEVRGKTYITADATHKVQEDTTALLLCYTGNAAIIAIGDTDDGTSYILYEDSVEELSASAISEHVTEPEFNRATVSGGIIYASPFTASGTAIRGNAGSIIVTVKSKVQFEGVLSSAYYEVEFTDEDGTVKTGYVAEGLLENTLIVEKPPETHPDPEYSESTSVTTVLLILAVVILVLVAVGYLVFTATSGKKKVAQQESAPTTPEKEEKE